MIPQVYKKTIVPELLDNECRVLKELGGLQGIPNISLEDDAIVMKKYQEFNKKLDLVQIRDVTHQIATILDLIHSKGYVHLDLSMENIMQDRDQIVLIDFTLSKHVEEEHLLGCGTPGYIAPEVYVEEKVYKASDMYSLGVILGQLLEPFLPGVSLHYLGSKLVRHPTTTFICKKLEQVLAERDSEWRQIQYHACDLLLKLLQFDHTARITTSELLKHPFLLADECHFVDFTLEKLQKRLLKRPISSFKKSSRDPIVYYRG